MLCMLAAFIKHDTVGFRIKGKTKIKYIAEYNYEKLIKDHNLINKAFKELEAITNE